MKKESKTTTKQKDAVKREGTTKSATKKVSAKDRIKPRGLWGIMKGKIHYDENADIFNLEL